ncbi:unnamed protein product, partial [Iphiclides podalirius]
MASFEDLAFDWATLCQECPECWTTSGEDELTTGGEQGLVFLSGGNTGGFGILFPFFDTLDRDITVARLTQPDTALSWEIQDRHVCCRAQPIRWTWRDNEETPMAIGMSQMQKQILIWEIG